MSEAAMDEVPEGGAEPHEVAPPTSTLGARLAAERESREWSIVQVASQLNLAPRQIQALETDNYAALPGMASVRGFVRAYAKLLKIDAEPLVAMIASEQITPTQPLEPRRNLSSTPFFDNRLISTRGRRSSSRLVLVAVIVLLLVVAAIAVERMGGWPTLSQSLPSQFKDISATPSGGPLAASASVSTPTSESEPASAPAVPAATGSESGVADAVRTAPSTASSAAEQKVDQAPRVTAAVTETVADKSVVAAKNVLVLTLRQDSWIEVRAGRKALISRLAMAGSTESLEITEPVVLTLGNAAGVDVTFRGSPLEIKSGAKNNVVRISLK
jgi:cytoskeleton protein RodZ